MVELTRLNGTHITINPFQIEWIEETPDTIILLNSGRKLVVKEKISEIKNKFSDFLSVAITKGIQNSSEG